MPVELHGFTKGLLFRIEFSHSLCNEAQKYFIYMDEGSAILSLVIISRNCAIEDQRSGRAFKAMRKNAQFCLVCLALSEVAVITACGGVGVGECG